MSKDISTASPALIAAVAQAWCTEENKHKEMDSVLAAQIILNVQAIHEAKPMAVSVQEGFNVLKQAMIKDSPSEPGSYAHSWHCNIAMMCYDAMASAASKTEEVFCHDDAYKISNDAASRFMKLTFDVETKQ